MTPDTRPDVTALIAAAKVELARMCERQWSGDAAIAWSIPARPAVDSDCIIADALNAAARRLTEQDAEIAYLQEREETLVKALTAAEQALAAALRERDEARALCERYVVDLCNERAARVNEARTP